LLSSFGAAKAVSFGRMQGDDIGFAKKQNPGFAVAKPG
jgi:hypothetical protein